MVPPPQMRKVPHAKLFVSEPPPEWFGNPENPSSGAAPGWNNDNWLKSRFHFSFAEYSNGGNDDYGVLRVMNDDLVQPGRGFGTHGHANMEICTYIVEGSLTHKDSMGTSETLGQEGSTRPLVHSLVSSFVSFVSFRSFRSLSSS